MADNNLELKNPPITPRSKTLRDEFAMAVLTGICSHSAWDNIAFAVKVEFAYECADIAMGFRNAH